MPKKIAKPKQTICDTVLPHDKLAEQAVLGSLIQQPELCDEVIMLLRDPEDFYFDAHQKIYDQILKMRQDNKTLDLLLLINQMSAAGTLEAAGGHAGIAELMESVPIASHAVHYAEIVKAKALLRRFIYSSSALVLDAYVPETNAQALVNKAAAQMSELCVSQSVNCVTDMASLMVDAIQYMDRQSQGLIDGVQTGFHGLDELTGGMHPNELLILAARPSVGKTALCLNIAENVAVHAKQAVLFVSLEMTRLELALRLICSQSRVNGYKVRRNLLNKEENSRFMDAADLLSRKPLYIDDTPSRTVGEIAAVARRLKQKEDLKLLIIDYIGLITPEGREDTRQEQVAKIARRLKTLSRELHVPVLCLAQLNRHAENEARPRLSMLRECLPVDEWVDTPCGPVQLKTKPKQVIGVDSTGAKIADCRFMLKRYNSVYTVTTRFGSFSATAFHRVLTATGWQYVGDLDVDKDVLASPLKIPHENRGYVPHGRLLGWLLGNGYLCNAPYLCLRTELLTVLKAETDAFGVEIRPKKSQRSRNYFEVSLANGACGPSPNPLTQWIRSLGLEGNTARDKFIPASFLGTSEEAHIELLRGLWETDGTVTKGQAAYTTASELLARQVKWLLHTVGVRSSITVEKQKNEKYADLYVVCCSEEDNRNMERIVNHPQRLKITNDQPAVIGCTTIQSITHRKQKVRVCDLNVPATGCFLVNGLIVHNSGAIEQDADVVMFLHRKDTGMSEEEAKAKNVSNQAELIVAKQRNGAIGDIDLNWIGEYTRFEGVSSSSSNADFSPYAE